MSSKDYTQASYKFSNNCMTHSGSLSVLRRFDHCSAVLTTSAICLVNMLALVYSSDYMQTKPSVNLLPESEGMNLVVKTIDCQTHLTPGFVCWLVA